MSRQMPYIVVVLLFIGAALIWWLPPVRLHTRVPEPVRRPTARATATPSAAVATPTATAAAPQAG